MKNIKQKLFYLWGVAAGALNGLLGAGGGMVVVPIIRRKMNTKEAHATSVAIILPICVASAVFYLINGTVTLGDAVPYISWGILGAVVGTFVLQKMSGKLLRIIFALLVIWAGIRLLCR